MEASKSELDVASRAPNVIRDKTLLRFHFRCLPMLAPCAPQRMLRHTVSLHFWADIKIAQIEDTLCARMDKIQQAERPRKGVKHRDSNGRNGHKQKKQLANREHCVKQQLHYYSHFWTPKWQYAAVVCANVFENIGGQHSK